MNHLDLFSGIGGFAYGFQLAGGFNTVAFVDQDKFCQRVLKKHWPDVPIFGDIHEFGSKDLHGSVDIITGGFPCQPFSFAGKRRGKDDDRYLWPEMLRVIKEFKPTWVIGENVAGIVNMELDRVLSDLEGEDYEVQTFIIPACAVNAPHKRDRVWIIGYSEHTGRNAAEKRKRPGTGTDSNEAGTNETVESQRPDSKPAPNTKGDTGRQPQFPEFQPNVVAGCGEEVNPHTQESRLERGNAERVVGTGRRVAERIDGDEWDNETGPWGESWVEVATRFCRVDDGVPNRVDRLKSLGNAIVPQIVEIIGGVIMEASCKRATWKTFKNYDKQLEV